MRLKTILVVVAALVGVCLPARSQGQLVSYLLDLRPGYNAIANPLNVGSNTVSELFPVVPPGSVLVKFTPGGTFVPNPYDDVDMRWTFNDGFAGTLLPGEGAFLLVQVPAQLTIFGDKVVPHAQLGARPGFNFVGCQTLEPCSFEELMGFSPAVGDAVYHFDQPAAGAPPNFQAEATRTNRFLTTGWDAVPQVLPGRGVFVEVASEPRVMIDPLRLRVPVGGTARFNAVVVGGPVLNYQWRFNGTPIAGQSGPNVTSLVIPNAQTQAAGQYSVVVQFGSGTVVTSLNARLFVDIPPMLVQPPQSLTVTQGGTAVFSARATGTPPLFYQWMRDGSVALPFGQDRTNFVIQNVQPQMAGTYFVIVTNFAGSVTSMPVALIVLEPPQIIIEPRSQMVTAGQNVTNIVAATGTQPFTYQWLLNGNLIPGANGPSLTINGIRPDQSGVYRVIVANAVGAAISDEAFIMVVGGDFNLADMFPGPVITGPNGFLQGSNDAATAELGEPRHAGKRGSNSVWVTYFANQAGIVTFRTRGSSFDTLLAAYTGNGFADIAEVASDDDSGGFLSSIISFSVQAGEFYRIAIDGHSGAQGQVVLTWNFEATADRLPLITTQPKSQIVVAGAPASFNVVIQGAADGLQWFFNGQPRSGATQPVLTIPNAQLPDVGQYFVRIRVGSHFVDSRLVELELRETDGPGQPPLLRAFDKFEELLAALAGDPPDARFSPASVVLGYTGSQTFSTVGSGGQNGEPVHCGVVGGHSKWYAYIPPASGTLFLNTDGSNFDTLLAVYTGCCTFNTLTPIDCDNNSGTNGLTSSLNFMAASNTVYYIAVDGVGGVTGSVKLNYRLLVPMMLTNLASTTNSLTFRLNATPQWPFHVQRSTNFLNWSNYLTGTSVGGLYIFTDTNLPPGRRFYRSMQTP